MTDTKHANNTDVVIQNILDRDLGWRVTLFDCYCHSFNEALEQLMKALACDLGTAMKYAALVQDFGSAVVFRGSESECERVGQILGATGLNVEVGQ